ncbi:Mss4-like protein [Schizophyllum fasciatum]
MTDNGTAHLPEPSTDDWMQHPPYGPPPDADKRKIYYTATCHCKRVKYAILCEEPKEAKFCHCVDCHKLFGSPAQWTAMLEKTDVHYLSGVDNLAFYHLPDSTHEHKLPCKVACRTCRSPVMDEGRKVLVIYPSLIDFGEMPRGEGDPRREAGSIAVRGDSTAAEGSLNAAEGRPTAAEGRSKFFPTCHIFYEQRVDDYVDGRPKYRRHKEDGETLPEHEW